ncbi:MAG: hypothetical protein ACE5WD_06460 [Candidatus Aminicenantia bacterium]
MLYKVSADLIVFIHFLWIIFLIGGAFIGRKYLWVMIVHLGGLVQYNPPDLLLVLSFDLSGSVASRKT